MNLVQIFVQKLCAAFLSGCCEHNLLTRFNTNILIFSVPDLLQRHSCTLLKGTCPPWWSGCTYREIYFPLSVFSGFLPQSRQFRIALAIVSTLPAWRYNKVVEARNHSSLPRKKERGGPFKPSRLRVNMTKSGINKGVPTGTSLFNYILNLLLHQY